MYFPYFRTNTQQAHWAVTTMDSGPQPGPAVAGRGVTLQGGAGR